jgi:hypothetical protein
MAPLPGFIAIDADPHTLTKRAFFNLETTLLAFSILANCAPRFGIFNPVSRSGHGAARERAKQVVQRRQSNKVREKELQRL